MYASTDSKQSKNNKQNNDVILGYSQISDHKRGLDEEHNYEKLNREFSLSSMYCSCPRPSSCSLAKSVC